MKGSIILILSLCIVFLGMNGCNDWESVHSGDSNQNANLSSNLTNETNVTCASNISAIKAQCNFSLDKCNENLCERCGDDMARAGGQPGTWACSVARLDNCVMSNSCGGDGTLNWSGNNRINYSNATFCSDSATYGSCATTLPQYCNNGTLVYNCAICGCPPSYLCLTTGQCQPICNDNTFYGSCSLTLPQYCSNGTLIPNCNMCGCPSGQTCNASICV